MLQVVPSDPVEKSPASLQGTPGKGQKTPDGGPGPSMIQVGNILQLIPSPSLSSTGSTPIKTAAPEKQMLEPVPVVADMSAASASGSEQQSLATAPMPAMTAASIVAALFKKDKHPLALPMPPAMSEAEKVEQKNLEKKQKRLEKEARKQAKLKKATKKMIRKALLFKEGLTLNSDVDNEEMKLIEEAMEASTTEETPVAPAVGQTVEIEDVDPVVNEQRMAALRRPLPPPPEKGILISPGFREKPIIIGQKSEAKSVSFADGIRPGEGQSPTNAEDHPHSPPPDTKLPKKKKLSKKKKKKKIKVKIIRVEEGDDDDDDEDDDISPPPPPPGSPPPMFHYPPPPPGFAYPPQAFTVPGGAAPSAGVAPPCGEGQPPGGYAPLYQQHHHSSTITTHTTTTVQFGPPPPPPPPPPPQK